MSVLTQQVIITRDDILALPGIDWTRLNGYWPSLAQAVDTLYRRLAGKAVCSIIEQDLRAAPQRADWPGWRHVGAHPEMGQLYWNYFHASYPGELLFGDEPDFSAIIRWPDDDDSRHVLGDIGSVSVSTFAKALVLLRPHDLWVSVLDEHRQMVIEIFLPTELYGDDPEAETTIPSRDKTSQNYAQLRLF